MSNTSLPLDCFSLTRDFNSPVIDIPYAVPASTNDKMLDRLEFYHGMPRGESEAILASEKNTILCRQDMAHILTASAVDMRVAIFPINLEYMIRKLVKIVLHNSQCSLDVRSVPEQDFPLYTYDYSFKFLGFNPTVYVRDPLTGRIVGHDAPYTEMPHISLTLNPCLWAVRTVDVGVILAVMAFHHDFAWPAFPLANTYSTKPVSIEFLYSGGHALGDFPNRRMPYTWKELGVPDLVTARKHGHDEVESDDGTVFTRNNWSCDRRGIKRWRKSATDTQSHSSGSRTLVDSAMASSKDREPVKAFAETEGSGDQWIHILKHRMDEATDKSTRKYYSKLARDVDRARSRPLPPVSKGPAKAPQRPSKIRRLL